ARGADCGAQRWRAAAEAWRAREWPEAVARVSRRADASAADARFMARAVALARRGLGRTHPNPSVGAVLVRNGRVVGEGFTAPAGGPRAEVAALRAAGNRARR